MKQLSIEEKAKRYDDRLEKAKKWYDANTNEGYGGIFEDTFPELKESEDEKIRKYLLICVKTTWLDDTEHYDGFTKEEVIAWLKSLRPQKQWGYNPYKGVVESIDEMCKHYDKASHSGLRDFYDNVKVKCKDAKEYDSLYPQNRWKPSDEQMEALKNCCNGLEDDSNGILDSLYNDLKAL